MLLGTLLVSAVDAGATDARSQAESAITTYIGERIEDEAASRGWEGLEHDIQLSFLTDPANLPPCRKALEVRTSGSNTAVTDRLRIEARCLEPAWSLMASTRQSLHLEVLATREPVERGATLDARHLKRERVDITRVRGGFMLDEEEVVGMSARRRLRADQTLSPGLLEAPLAVERGQRVRLIARDAGIEASTVGEALADGRIGDVIRVRNLASERVVDARIIEPGMVSTTFH